MIRRAASLWGVLFVVAFPCVAVEVADYRFQDSLSSFIPGAPDLSPLGGGGFVDATVDATAVRGWAFPVQTGLDLDVTGLVGSALGMWGFLRD